ncbi:type I restriction endonuclease subunit R [Thalassomonas viridans]|uniref:Type I restriction enzyme endonuclease subunit n=1 Tax=Thalassomonas viridans TaxID=137584 RepID=A0AAE9Z805_9GAMM|nr:type I restriction endonuclease subunit R [Thalassomonas viridans]WDE07942.1 type I restriction endonuclease subunit R [Thalassomonas viridans]
MTVSLNRQSEQVLEDNLVEQLVNQGYQAATIRDEKSLLENLKLQLEKLNNLPAKGNKAPLSDNEFRQVLNALAKGAVFEKAKTLRDRLQIDRDDGTALYVQFLADDWEKNQFQVTQQVTVEGRYQNRYDVTILVNGLPLVQIELKRRGLELKEAFNQINRYHQHSYWASYGLFQYVQCFVISNGVNTKYYANNKNLSFKQTFYWADEDNNRYSELTRFTETFLQRQQLATLIQKYVVLNQTDRILMVMRPYQIYATEAIVERVVERNEIAATGQRIENFNGYIWHATGSGKTLTSFKTAQILTGLSQVFKVVFVVDRKDLDYQTSKEFNGFAKGCVDSTDNTRVLVNQFTDAVVSGKGKASAKVNERRNSKLIVTTIQKLNNAISHKRYLSRMEKLKDKPVVFIFDECHRSQFGETHKRIVNFFNNQQMFGFTGTPILVENAVSKTSRKTTTKDLFDECLHKYTIVDAIKDENVLKFAIEYVGRYKRKETSKNEVDIDVEDIDTKELLDSSKRLEKITDYIIAHHNRKTHSKTFTAMFCVSSIETLITYYELFKAKKNEGKHNLRIATIFSYNANEEYKNSDEQQEQDNQVGDTTGDYISKTFNQAAEPRPGYSSQLDRESKYSHSRDKLEQYIGDYNAMYDTSFTTKDNDSFYNYYNDISRKVRERKIDILLVVKMFLTGFDSKPLNTLYVDQNLQHHGLIQAYSRTNRILSEQKSQGNIISFRNLKKATDDALTLFSNKDAQETVIMPPYEDFVRLFNEALARLTAIAPSLSSVDQFEDEAQELEFVKAFRELMRLKNVLNTFADFDFVDIGIDEQGFEDYKSKYLDLYDKVKTDNRKEKVSILEEVDFELELIQCDEVNVRYILQLLAQLKGTDNEKEYQYQYKKIMQSLGSTPELRSKKELIEQFIQSNLEHLDTPEEVIDAFDTYWEAEKVKAVDEFCKEEALVPENLMTLVDKMIYTNEEPLREEIVATMEKPPGVLQRKKIIPRLTEKLKAFVGTFYKGM